MTLRPNSVVREIIIDANTGKAKGVRVIDQLAKVRMQVEAFNGNLRRSQQPHRKADTARRLKNVNSAAHAVNRSGKIERPAFEEVLPLFGADNLPPCFDQILRCDWFAYCPKRAANPQRGGQASFQVQVTGAMILCQADQCFQIHC
jgi:hypothetical protein